MSSEIQINDEVGIDETRNSAAIQADIRNTRSRMDATLDQLGNKLNARSLLNSALDWWDSPDRGEGAQSTLKDGLLSVARQAKRHPMPAVLIASGVAWLVSELADKDNHRSGRSSMDIWPDRDTWPEESDLGQTSDRNSTLGNVSNRMGALADRTSSIALDAVESAKSAASSLGEGIHETADRMGQSARTALDSGKAGAGHLLGELRHGYDLGSDKLSRSCNEYPLAVGLACAAAGALVGLVIPRSKREDEFMGPQSDELLAEAKEKAGELFDKGKEVGSKVLETVKSEAAEQGLDTASAADLLKDLVQKGTEVVEKAKTEAVSAVRNESSTNGSENGGDHRHVTPS